MFFLQSLFLFFWVYWLVSSFLDCCVLCVVYTSLLFCLAYFKIKLQKIEYAIFHASDELQFIGFIQSVLNVLILMLTESWCFRHIFITIVLVISEIHLMPFSERFVLIHFNHSCYFANGHFHFYIWGGVWTLDYSSSCIGFITQFFGDFVFL